MPAKKQSSKFGPSRGGHSTGRGGGRVSGGRASLGSAGQSTPGSVRARGGLQAVASRRSVGGKVVPGRVGGRGTVMRK
jgi:hypothetical protein